MLKQITRLVIKTMEIMEIMSIAPMEVYAEGILLLYYGLLIHIGATIVRGG